MTTSVPTVRITVSVGQPDNFWTHREVALTEDAQTMTANELRNWIVAKVQQGRYELAADVAEDAATERAMAADLGASEWRACLTTEERKAVERVGR